MMKTTYAALDAAASCQPKEDKDEKGSILPLQPQEPRVQDLLQAARRVPPQFMLRM